MPVALSLSRRERAGPALAILIAIATIAAPAFAQDATVTTHATARERLANTVADVQLGLEARGRTVAEVQATLAAGSTTLLAFLGGAKVDRLRTQGVAVQPELDATPGRPRITGYTGRVSVVFQVDSGRLGAILTDALAKGANTIDGTALHPTQADMDAARNRLAAEATKASLEQARVVAEAAGRRLGPVKSIAVDGAQGFARPMMARAAVTAAPIGTEAGDSEISASVTTVVTLAQP